MKAWCGRQNRSLVIVYKPDPLASLGRGIGQLCGVKNFGSVRCGNFTQESSWERKNLNKHSLSKKKKTSESQSEQSAATQSFLYRKC